MGRKLLKQRRGQADALSHFLAMLLMVPMPAAEDVDALSRDARNWQRARPCDEGEPAARPHQFQHHWRRRLVVGSLDSGVGAIAGGRGANLFYKLRISRV